MLSILNEKRNLDGRWFSSKASLLGIVNIVNGSDGRVSFLRHSSKSFIFISHFLLLFKNEAICKLNSPLKAGLSKANSCLAFSGSSLDTNLGSEKGRNEDFSLL